jgi:DNA polymerase-1
MEMTRYNGHTILDGHGYEADDFIACISQMLKNRYDVVIVTTDKDLFQLVDKYIRIYDPIKGIYINLDNFFNVTEVRPESFLDYKCIRGDDSDNIPGIDLFGEITTKKFLSEYGSYEKMYDEISKKEKRLKKEDAILNREVYERNKELMDLSLYFMDTNLKTIIKERVANTAKDDKKLYELLVNNDLSHYYKKIK